MYVIRCMSIMVNVNKCPVNVNSAGFVVFPYRIVVENFAQQRKVSPFVNSWLSNLIIRTKNCNEDFLAFLACQLFNEDSFS